MQDTRTSHSPYVRIASQSARRTALLLGLALLAASCSSPPPKPVVTPVSINLVASADANPDARGRASPLTVRVYVLKAPGPFQGADFFSLYDKDQATLGAELVKREELLINPGESRKLEFTLEPDAKNIAVLAAFRDLERSRWRDLKPLDVGKPNNFTVNLAARQVRIDPK
ncbi:MAG: type VI secretion system lipoprotein TssJ [Proteobacteria bacterium]|nr:type VI secretion system lipoprotein TssJ [Pseudomonadota bacterium]